MSNFYQGVLPLKHVRHASKSRSEQAHGSQALVPPQFDTNESALLKPRSNFRMTLHMTTSDAPEMFASCAMQACPTLTLCTAPYATCPCACTVHARFSWMYAGA